VRDELLTAIRTVSAGGKHIPASIAQQLVGHMQSDAISEREIQVLSLVAVGKRNKEIAADLSIAEDTVKMHVRNIFSKLDVTDRTEAVTVALRRGIIHL
jgi:DNA-binding NarL/FixJ family response regulator